MQYASVQMNSVHWPETNEEVHVYAEQWELNSGEKKTERNVNICVYFAVFFLTEFKIEFRPLRR